MDCLENFSLYQLLHYLKLFTIIISSVQLLSRVQLFVTPWTAARQASLSTNSQSSLRLISIELVMPCSHLIFCHPLLLLPPIPPSIKVFSNESTLRRRWPKYWSFSFSIIHNWFYNRKVMTNLDSIFKSRDITFLTKVHLVKAMVFPGVMYGVRVGLWRKLSTKELMLLYCGVGEDSWESLGLQGDPTSPFWRRSVLNIHWKDWC